jgi:hypothetical protein
MFCARRGMLCAWVVFVLILSTQQLSIPWFGREINDKSEWYKFKCIGVIFRAQPHSHRMATRALPRRKDYEHDF